MYKLLLLLFFFQYYSIIDVSYAVKPSGVKNSSEFRKFPYHSAQKHDGLF